jgi:3-oxoacyl-[acyl-carrier protein] reductase
MPEGSRVILLSTSLVVNTSIPPNYLLYVTTKGAIEQMVRVMARDLGRKGINVNAMAPGPTGTDLFLQGKPDAMIKAISAASPFNRLGQADEIADAIAFLSGPDSRWVSGQVLRVNGAAY